MDKDSNCWCNFGLTYDIGAPRSAESFFEGLTSGTAVAPAVIDSDAASIALAIIIVLAVTGFAADVGFGACGGLVHAVGGTACGAI